MNWEAMADRELIEKLMGHAGRTVTAKYYDRPGENALASAVAKLYAGYPYADGWDI